MKIKAAPHRAAFFNFTFSLQPGNTFVASKYTDLRRIEMSKGESRQTETQTEVKQL